MNAVTRVTYRLEVRHPATRQWMFATEGSLPYCREAVGRLVTGVTRIVRITTTTEVIE